MKYLGHQPRNLDSRCDVTMFEIIFSANS
jgi:hypothetical protein